MDFNKKDLIKSPLNYTGGKYKLLPQILPLFPSNISMFYDVFGGGGNVSLNCGADYIYYNDIIHFIGSMFNDIKGVSSQLNLQKVLNVIKEYELSKINEEGFKRLRRDFNKGKNNWEYLYSLITHSFNYQMRFNNNLEYNSSFGKGRICFNTTLQEKFVKFVDKLNEIDIVFDNKDFREIDFSDANGNDLVYFDSPYLIGNGVYQDGKRGFKGWNKQDDLDLIQLADKLNEKDVRFAMSNVFENKDMKNDDLIEWSKKYNVNYLDINYDRCNYQRKKSKTTEVLITNYKI